MHLVTDGATMAKREQKVITLSHGKTINITEPTKLRVFKDGKHMRVRLKRKRRKVK
jgi:hypothetical protein